MNICNDINFSNCLDIAKNLNTVRKIFTILIVGKMSIDYVGRASSYAYPDNRLVIVKPDGTLLIHESTHVEPLNWQPPKSIPYFECIGNKLRLRSIRENPREEVIVEFLEIEFVKICKLSTTKLVVIGRESDIVKLITSNPGILVEGSTIVGIDITTPYGKIDLLIRKNNKLIVIEVKNEKAGISAVVQLKRYVEYYSTQGQKVDGILVAPEITREALSLLTREGFTFISIREFLNKIKISSLEKLLT